MKLRKITIIKAAKQDDKIQEKQMDVNATSKLVETVRAGDNWLLLDMLKSVILPGGFEVLQLHKYL